MMMGHCRGWICNNYCDRSIENWWRHYYYRQRDKHRLASATQRIKKRLLKIQAETQRRVLPVSDSGFLPILTEAALPSNLNHCLRENGRDHSFLIWCLCKWVCLQRAHVLYTCREIFPILYIHICCLSAWQIHTLLGIHSFFCALKGEVETGWERWSKEELQRRTEGGRLMEPVSGGSLSLKMASEPERWPG